jgi:hypothetical protein
MYVSIAFYGSVNVCGESGEMLVLPGERCRCDDTTCDTSCTLLSRMVVIFTRFMHFFLPPPRPALNYVTCGSLVKLKHVTSEARLHSHNVNYMTGSRQQSVTGLKSAADPSSFWTIREPYGQPQCIQGFVVECFPLHTDRLPSTRSSGFALFFTFALLHHVVCVCISFRCSSTIVLCVSVFADYLSGNRLLFVMLEHRLPATKRSVSSTRPQASSCTHISTRRRSLATRR